MLSYRIVLPWLFLLVAALPAWASPTVKEHRINGYRVLLINQHQGNAAQVGVDVQTGSWHDEPVQRAGLAHLWEHVIHRGNTAFPDGEQALMDLNNELGGTSNAYTSHDRTYYHMYGHPGAMDRVMKFLGALVSSPLWDPAAFEAEKKVVMNEALQYQASPMRAMESTLFMSLLPQGHPLRMYNVGSQEQLKAIELGDLQDLYFANYQPGMMTVIVAGNFDTAVNGVAPLDEKAILDAISRNFIAPRDPRPAPKRPELYFPHVQKHFPSIIPSDPKAARIIEVGTPTAQKLLSLYFEIPREIARDRREALELLLDYLNLSTPGSLMGELRNQGWITGGGASPRTVNNLTVVTVAFGLTDEGVAHRYEIPSRFLAALGELRKHGIPESLLQLLRERNINAYEKEALSPADAAELVAKHAKDVRDFSGFFDFKARYGSVKNEDILAAAQVFDPRKLLVGYVGSDVDSTERAPVFGVPVRIVPSESHLQDWLLALETPSALDPRFTSIPVRFSKAPKPAPDTGLKSLPSARSTGRQIHWMENHRSTMGAVFLRLKTAPPSIRGRAAQRLFVQAFLERFDAQGEFLSSMGIDVELQSSVWGLKLRVDGNAQASIDALAWYLDQLASFVPTEAEIESARQGLLMNEVSARNRDFSAAQALSGAQSLLNRFWYDSKQIGRALRSLSAQDVLRLNRRGLSRADVQLTLLGDYDENEVRALASGLERRFPNPLTEAQRAKHSSADLRIPEGGARAWKALTAAKGLEDLGLARVYQGPPALTRDHAALLVLGEVIASEVFILNRSIKGLGYTHSAMPYPTDHGIHLALYGETDRSERWGEIAQGWDEVLAKIKVRELSANGFRDEIRGLVRGGQLAPVTLAETLDHLQGQLDEYGTADAKERLFSMIATLTEEEIYAAAERYLLGSPSVEVTATRRRPSDCDSLLSTHHQLKEELKKASR